MRHIALALLCLTAALPGCATIPAQSPPPPSTPPSPAPSPAPPPPPHTIRLFEEVEPTYDAVRQAVLRHVPVGTPISQAQAALEAQGFTCRPYSVAAGLFLPDELVPRGVVMDAQARQRHVQRANRPVYARVTLPELQEWHLRF